MGPARNAATSANHLDESTVLHYLRGALGGNERARVHGHIDRCAECRELISALASSTQAPTEAADAVPSGVPPGPEWHRGTLLAQRFEIEERVQRGGMGTVFRARDRQTGALIAVKATFWGSAGSDVPRFEREAEILAALNHPAIVRYVARGRTSHGDTYLIMEWIEGESLASRLARGPLAVHEALRLAKRLAQGLWFAHARGVIHRDVKPSNVMLRDGSVDQATLVDFGIARSSRATTMRTQTGMLVGTPSYMAPEQARGRQLDTRADIFALGCVLYECLTGRRAFSGDDLLEVLARVLLDTPTPPSRWAPSVPPALDGLVLWMLAKDPSQRVPTCRDVIAALQPLLEQEASPPGGGPPAATPQPAALPSMAPAASQVRAGAATRRIWVATLVAVAALAGGSAIALGVAAVRRNGAVARAPGHEERSAPVSATGVARGADKAMPVSSLTTLSLARTPEAMAEITGRNATPDAVGDIEMAVPLSGGAFTRLRFRWDPSDPTHVQGVTLDADAPVPDDATIRRKLAALLGARFDKDGDLSWEGVAFSYEATHVRAAADAKLAGRPNPNWKAQMDAAWDLLRGAVLGLPVTVGEATQRDWLGGGYPLSAIAALDATVDVDHAEAVMRRAFPGVSVAIRVGLEHTIAVDHPWYGSATLSWKNAAGGALQSASLLPRPDANGMFPDQGAVEACARGMLGSGGRRTVSDHLRAEHDTMWFPARGGTVRVYGHMVVVALVSPFARAAMDGAEFARILRGFDACGRT
jgi:hypothetical protein